MFTLAEQLQHAAFFLGSAEGVDADFDRHMKVTTDDVRRAAAFYLRPDNSLSKNFTVEARA